MPFNMSLKPIDISTMVEMLLWILLFKTCLWCQKKIEPSLWCLENSEAKYADLYWTIIYNQIP